MKTNIIFYVSVFLVLMAFAYFLITFFKDIKNKGFVEIFFNKFSEREEDRELQEAARILYEGEVEKRTYIEKLDILIKRSQIKAIFPFITSEILTLTAICLGLLVALITNLALHLWIINITVFFSVIFVIFVILKFLSKLSFDKIDGLQLNYINLLENLSSSNNSIVVIFDKSIPYAGEPLKSYAQQFVYECKAGISVVESFKNFEDKVENIRFKQLLRNLAMASMHDASYEKLFKKSRKIFKNYYVQKEKRRKSVISGAIILALTIVAGVISFSATSTFTGNIFVKFITTPQGNIMLGYFILIFIYTIYKSIALGKLNY
ncbi:type II secretion system F family protein [Clostridium akagii]|uniref:type II secretion system F family protein n=1 Tax=Clostridium akagii TaxID=91623 RepID=UPI000479D9A8|nr:hypothetical protein [Clostridium akagii]